MYFSAGHLLLVKMLQYSTLEVVSDIQIYLIGKRSVY